MLTLPRAIIRAINKQNFLFCIILLLNTGIKFNYFLSLLVCVQNQVCAGFQSCVAQVDAAVCLKQMVTALSSLLPPATTGAPVGGTPCQGGAGAPIPMPVPMPMPMPMPMPEPITYPVQPSSCGGTYPCGDEESKSKSKKHHDEHKHKED